MTSPENTLYKPSELVVQANLLLTFRGQCVTGAKKLLNIDKPIGWAGNVKVQKREPIVGDIAKMSPIHVGVVLEVFEDTVKIFDCNYNFTGHCRIITAIEDKMLGYTTWR